MTDAVEWLIYSRQHNLWWRPNSAGYTSRIEDAGRYSEEDARARCKLRCEPGADEGPHEVMVPAPEAAATIERLERERDEARNKAIVQAFNYINHAAANNYHGDPDVQKLCDVENGLMADLAADMLEGLAPERFDHWKSLDEALTRAEAAEAQVKALTPPKLSARAMQDVKDTLAIHEANEPEHGSEAVDMVLRWYLKALKGDSHDT